MVVVTLSDGRSISTPRLESASPADLAEVELTPLGVHWPRLDEDLSIEGMLAGRRPTVPR
ncbi:DUF2442 domain-containing protein [Bradyrhizobium rifense]|uniref:DUF2442 domain-containing protein n=2 Tax=Bradyrhizobium rifense TaxID=515499 RepID=A0A5D3JZ31_9BRAD|nr:DUF2442 domain-containing protein [Bradyrhizobium rifense]